VKVKCFGCDALIEADTSAAAADAFVVHARERHTWSTPEEALRNYARNVAEAPERLTGGTERLAEIGDITVYPVTEDRVDDWLRFFDVNVLSGVRLARLYLPAMRRANWGRIIFISSESGVQIPAEMIHYGMTKTAQLAVSRGLAESLAGTNITVNSILPGPTKSRGVGDFVDQLAQSRGMSVAALEKEFFAHARPTSLIKRFASTQEVASMVAYIASPLASATTGAALRVDGGVVKSAV